MHTHLNVPRHLLIAAALVALPLAAQARTDEGTTPEAGSTTGAQTSADASAEGRAVAEMARVTKSGAQVSAKARARADAKLDASAKSVDEESGSAGDKVAARLAGEFGGTADAMATEQQQLGCSWGALMIAHTLEANATTDLTVANLVQMHADGTGWGQIAAGLGLKLGELVSAVQSEAKVAEGKAQADGKVAVVHGNGAKVGLGAHAGTGVNAAVGHSGVNAGVGLGVGTGVKIKP